MAGSDFDQVVDESHRALDAFFKGDPEPMKKLYSHREDVSLANPFGPAVRGWTRVEETMQRAASHYRGGGALGFDAVAAFATPELRYIVEVERYRAKVGGRDDITPVTLRVTSIFRREDDTWRIAHRHADPITSAQSAESVLQK